MTGELKAFMKRLENQGLNLLVLKNGEPVYSSGKGGMAPLLDAIDRLGLSALRGSTVVDRIVGKAAALLISYFGAKDVYAGLLSRGALVVLEKHRIRYASEKVVDNIMNEDKTDICPFEKMVLGIEDPREGYEKLSRELTHRLHQNKPCFRPQE